MKRVHTALDLPEARLLADTLTRAGIPARVFNEFAQGAMGDIPFQDSRPEVWVLEDRDQARAEQLLTDLRARVAAMPERACPACGEVNPGSFELCWRCATLLPGTPGR